MHRSRIAASRLQSATCSTRSRNIGSPQWMSSRTRTRGCSRPRDSRNRRIAQKVSSGAPPSPAAKSRARFASIADACSSPATVAAIAALIDVRLRELRQAEGAPEGLGHRVPRDPLAVREAAAAQDLSVSRGMGSEELLDQAALAGAGGAQHREQLAGPVGGSPLEGPLEERRLPRPPHHRGVEAPGPHRGQRGDPGDPVRGDRLGLAPQDERCHRLGDDGIPDEAPGRLADEDGPGLGARLDPRRGVHRVPDERGPVAGDENLAGRHPDPGGEREGRGRRELPRGAPGSRPRPAPPAGRHPRGRPGARTPR